MRSKELRRAGQALVLPFLLFGSGTALADNQVGKWILAPSSAGNYQPVYSNAVGSAVKVMVTACGDQKNTGLVDLALLGTKSNILRVLPGQCETALVNVPANNGLQIVDRVGGVTGMGSYAITTPVP